MRKELSSIVSLAVYRSIVLAFLFLPIITSVQARSWDSLLAEANAARRSEGVEAAVEIGHRALELARAVNGEVDSSVALVLHRLGVFHHAEPYDTALVYYLRAMRIWERLDPQNPLNEAKTLNNLGSLYDDLGKYELSVDYYTRALALKSLILDENDNSLARAYRNLGEALSDLGRYIEAEDYLMRALKIRLKILPAGHPDIASTENLLGILFLHRNQYDKAEYWYQRAIATSALRLGHTPPGYANNLGLVWLDRGKYKQAESLYAAILDDTTTTDAFEGLNRALVWNNLGLTHQMMKRDREAVIEFDSALEITGAKLGTEHPEYARRLCNKGKSLGRMGAFEEAQSLLLWSLEIRQKNLSEFQPDVCHSLRALGWLHRDAGKPHQALDYFIREQQIYRRLINWLIPGMTQRDALSYAAYLQSSTEQCLATLNDIKDADPLWIDSITTALIYDVKGIVSTELASRAITRSDSTNPVLEPWLREYSDLQARMFAMLAGSTKWSPSERALFDSLVMRSEELETLTVARSPTRNRQSTAPVNARIIATGMPERSALVEYFLYESRDPLSGISIPHYLALVIKPDSAVRVYRLGPAAQVHDLIADYQSHFRMIVHDGVFPGEKQLRSYDSIACGLFEFFLAPLASELTDIDRLYVAPDGRANLISFAGLKNSEGIYLVEKWPVHYLHCGRDLMPGGDSEIDSRGLLAVGDPDFDFDCNSHARNLNANAHSVALPSLALRGNELSEPNRSLVPLPGTRTEVQSVKTQWASVSAEPAVILLGKEASERSFREKLPGQRVIYIATHGFFEDNSLAARLPFLHCGLFLAGANRSTAGQSFSPNDDGIVTAQDILAIDLRGVELVVMSACESGLGEVSRGEGIFGLSRAFQFAGSKSVVSSLWQVPDGMTAEMMGGLVDRSEDALMNRLRSTQLKQIERLRQKGLVDHPFSWAAFISSGEWR